MLRSVVRLFRQRPIRPEFIESAPPATATDNDAEYQPPKLTEAEAAGVDSLRQGDYAEVEAIPLLGSEVKRLATPHGVVLLTQTCDAVRPEKLTVSVAPLAKLEGNDAREAAGNKRLRYVHVPCAGENLFADMYAVATVEKGFFLGLALRRGIEQSDDDAVRRFGRAIGRRFSRFPFPDEVVPWLRPLEQTILKKHGKQGAEAALLASVAEFRIEAVGGWADGAPYSLNLCILVEPSTLPSYVPVTSQKCEHCGAAHGEDLVREVPPDLKLWLEGADGSTWKTPASIAERLVKALAAHESDEEVYWLWNGLADAWARQCKPDLSKVPAPEREAVAAAVEEISAELLETDDFSYERYRYSELVDLDHLSPPMPL